MLQMVLQNFTPTFRCAATAAFSRRLDPKRTWRNCSLDHLVGAGEQGWRHGEAERLGSLHVDH